MITPWLKFVPYLLGGYFANDIIEFFNKFLGKDDNDSGGGGFNFLTLGFLVVGYLIFREFNK